MTFFLYCCIISFSNHTRFIFYLVPVQRPSNVKYQNINGTAILVTWDPVPNTREAIKGRVLGYEVRCFTLVIDLFLEITVFSVTWSSTLSFLAELLLSADKLFKQFGPRPEPTKCWSRSRYKLFDTLIVFLEKFLETLI